MAELGVGYLSIVPETSKIAPGIKSALGAAEKHAEPSGQSMGSRIAGGIGTAVSTGLKTVAGGAVAAGVAGIGTAMVKGFQRLDAIDNANAKLTGLGHSAAGVQRIMDDSLASVKGTAFGLGEAASLAAGAVASGIKPGQDLQRVLSLTGDAATIAGSSMGEMGQIFNKVAATNKVQGDVLNQLGERGIPIIQMLATEMGVTAEEAVKMASEGKIGFETFANAMESQLGGAALEGAKTFRGALANLGAAAGRLGAEVLGPGFSAAPSLIGKATDAVDDLTAKAGPAAERVAALVSSFDFGAAAERTVEFISGLGDTFSSSGLAPAMGSVATAVGSIASAASTASPAVASIGQSLAEVSASIGVSGLTLLATSLEAVAGITSGVLAPALGTVAGFMESQPGLVTAAVVSWGLFKTVPSILGKVTSASAGTVTALKGMATANQSVVQSSSVGALQLGRFGSAVGELGTKVPVVAKMQTSFIDAATGAQRFGRTAGTAAAAMTGMKAGASSVIGALGGPWTIGLAAAGAVVADFIASAQSAKRVQQELAAASAEGAAAQHDLTSALVASSGAMDDQAMAAAQRIVQAEFDKTTAVAGQNHNVLQDLASAVNRTTLDYDGFSRVVENSRSGMERSAAATEMAKLEQQALGDATAEVGISLDDVSKVVADGGPRFEALQDALARTGDAGLAVAENMERSREAISAARDRASELGPEYLSLRDSMDVLADSAASAEDRFSALRNTLELLGFISPTAEQAMIDLAAKTDAMAEAATKASFAGDEFGRSFLNLDGTLNLSNTATHELAGSLGGMRDELTKVAAAGGDVDAAWRNMQPELDVLRDKMSEAGADHQKLLDQFMLSPEGIEIMVTTSGLDDSSNQVLSSINQLREKATNKPIPVNIDSQDAVDTLDSLGVKVTGFDAVKGTAMVQLDADHALRTADDMAAVLDLLAGDLTFLDGMDPQVKIDADATAAQGRIDEIVGELNALDATEVSPEISAIIDQFMAGRDVSVAELEALDTTTASPQVQLLIQQLLEQARIANTELDNVARPRTVSVTPYIPEGSLGALQASINSIRFTAPVTATLAGATGGRAMGGRIPRNADGGRLPKTGPGTDRTDGILGVSSDTGTPTSFVDAGEWVVNRESSEKYNGVLAAINRDDPRVRGLQALAAGGRVGMASKQDLLDLAWGRSGEGPPLEGDPYVYGGKKWGDCSSAQYAFAAKLSGLPPFGSRFSTSTMATELAAMGFTMGSLGGENDYNVGWYGHGTGGHTVGAIGRTNVEMGGAYGGGKIGGTASPWESIYTQKAHKPMGALYGISGINAHMDGAEGYPGGGAGTYSGAGGGGRSGYESGSDVDRGDAPRTWGDVAGLTAKSFAQGYTTDLLSVLGLSDDLPPALKAAQEWKASERAQAERAAKRAADRAGGQGPKALDEVAAQRQANALLDKEESLRKAREAVAEAKAGDSKGVVDQGKVRDAEGRAAKAERDLELAKMQAAQARVTSGAPSSSPSAQPPVRQYNSGGGDRDVGDPGGVPQGGWGDMVAHALNYAGQRDTMQDAVLDRINAISGGDPDFVSRAPWADALTRHNSGQGIDQALAEATASGVFSALRDGAAMGLMGVTATGFAHYRDSELPDDEFHPMSNVVAKINEVIDVHGSLEKAWANAPGFWNGGTARHSRDVFPAWLADGEEVTRTADAERGGNRDILQAMRSGATFSADGSGGGQHTHFHVTDVDAAFRRWEIDQFERGMASTGGGPLW
ncbi:tape measure protein [Dietzia maris]|uniref:Tape measure protein n=1 Tax=Dietzia maris TaxID=37915 RepID=A0AAE4QXM8_9ACTN|nr:tape measure protein [Dietzia maris]MDV6299950.1 tape measure protein [Dietzia maris]